MLIPIGATAGRDNLHAARHLSDPANSLDTVNATVGLVMGKQDRACGVCGAVRLMSRAHVPPQAAGNDSRVRRNYLISGVGGLTRGRATEGGMWVFGLCEACNNRAGFLYDLAYADFANGLWSWYSVGQRLQIPSGVPALTLAPGRVARSILYGLMAISPQVQVMHPSLGRELLAGSPVHLPEGMSLRVAAFLGQRAQLTGPVLTAAVLGDGTMVNTYASVTFRPLAWALSTSDSTAYFDAEGWMDATDWLLFEDDATRHLNWMTRKFPVTRTVIGEMPPAGMQLFSSEIAPIMQGELAS
jgi:hypothetical protein